MSPDPHAAAPLEQEIAEIENRRGTRNLFLALGGLVVAVVLVIVIFGARERSRLMAEAARPKVEEVALGRYLATVSNQAVFAGDRELHYVEGLGDVTIDGSTTFVRPLSYDDAGQVDPLPFRVAHWSLVSSDSLPYVIEPVLNPLTGVSPADYRDLEIATMSRADYGSAGPNDWRQLEEDATNIRVTGLAERMDGVVYIVDEPSRVRLQGLEGLSALDSLEIDWASQNQAPITAFGRVATTPSSGDPALFVLRLTAIDPPPPAEAETPPAPGEPGTSTPPGASGEPAPSAPAAPAGS